MKKISGFFCAALSLLLAAKNATAECPTKTAQLTAGQTLPVGTVSISNDNDNVYVNYTLTYDNNNDGQVDASFGTLHLWIGNSLLLIPSNNNGIPIPGQFCNAQGGACYDATGLTSYTFTVPWSQISLSDINQLCGSNLYVATHAEVDVQTVAGGSVDSETAWGGEYSGSGPRWWFYSDFSVCCDTNPPVGICETAYAKGGYVWTTNRKSNPERLPSLQLTQNRWGWAIRVLASGTTTYPIYAGAGLNNINNAALIGTATVTWNGSIAVFDYDLVDGAYMEEVHVYAGDTSPTTIAPGQYGYTYDTDGANSHTASFEVQDANGDGIWVVMHAVACR